MKVQSLVIELGTRLTVTFDLHSQPREVQEALANHPITGILLRTEEVHHEVRRLY